MKFKLSLLIMVALFFTACGSNTDVTLSVTGFIGGVTGKQVKDAKEIPADGKSYFEISAKLKSVEGEVFTQTPVLFKTTYGSFDKEKDDVKELTARTDGDTAKAILYAPKVKGDAVVEVTYDESRGEGQKVTKAIDLKFGNLAEGDKLSACHFKLSCKAKNLGAYVNGVSSIATECTILTKNRKQEVIDVPDIQFKTEVGQVITMPGDTPSENRYFYVVNSEDKPMDVDPLTAAPTTDCSQCTKGTRTDERCRCGLSGEIVNPRDGLVTIIAYANGEECFNDVNSNGEFDMGEPVLGTFLGEPYVDANDNGERDGSGIYQESYVESFGDPNAYDDENGIWDTDTTIWTQTKILLTGDPHESDETTRVETLNGDVINLTAGDEAGLTCNTSKQYYLYLMDKFMNPIATNETKSTMTIKMTGDDILKNYDKDNTQLNFKVNKYGFTLDDAGEVSSFNLDDNEFGIRYLAKVENSVDNCEDYDGTEGFEVEFKISTVPGIKNDQYDGDTKIEKTWSFTGKIK